MIKFSLHFVYIVLTSSAYLFIFFYCADIIQLHFLFILRWLYSATFVYLFALTIFNCIFYFALTIFSYICLFILSWPYSAAFFYLFCADHIQLHLFIYFELTIFSCIFIYFALTIFSCILFILRWPYSAAFYLFCVTLNIKYYLNQFVIYIYIFFLFFDY